MPGADFIALDTLVVQIPKVVKNFVIITTVLKETDESRGEDGARTLCITKNQLESVAELGVTVQTLIAMARGIPGILSAALPVIKYIPRTKNSLRCRQALALIFPAGELTIISYLIYVGK